MQIIQELAKSCRDVQLAVSGLELNNGGAAKVSGVSEQVLPGCLGEIQQVVHLHLHCGGIPLCMCTQLKSPNPRSPISNQDELVHCKLIPLWTHLLHLTHVFVFAAGFIFLVKSFF